jgi:hypothetical protein
MKWKVPWSLRVSREATEGDVQSAYESLMRDVERALEAFPHALTQPVVIIEIVSTEPLSFEADRWADAFQSTTSRWIQ